MTEPIKWTTFAAFGGVVESETHTLMLYISELGGAWGVFALETAREITHPGRRRRRRGDPPLPSAAERVLQQAQQVLDHHAHEIVGRAEGIAEAFHLADEYAKTWRARKQPQPVCACQEIAS